MSKYLGDVSAYAYAVSKGYTGTEEEFAELMASYATVGQTAVTAAESALNSKTAAQTAATTATNKASEATTAATTATNKASEAQTSAQTASTKASEASTSAQTASTKASQASQSASQALTYKTAAESAKTASQTAQGLAETAQTAAETAQGLAEDARDLAQQYAESIDPENIYSAYPTDTASGAVASFADGADDIPLKSLVVNIDPVQSGSGDPLPDNVRPISGWTGMTVSRTGINQWDEEWEEGYYGSTGMPSGGSGFIRSKNYISVKPNESYYCKTGTASDFCLQFYGADKAFLSQNYMWRDRVVTIPSDCYYLRFWRNETTYANNVSINYPSTDHDYHPYSGRSITIDLGQTVYGGRLDVLSGVLTVDRAMVDLGTLTWSYSTNYTRFSAPISGVKPTPDNYTVANLICSQYAPTYSNKTAVASGNRMIAVGTSAIVFVRDESYTDAAPFKTAMDGVQLVYELATPITIQLTPHEVRSLLGQNNIFADTGDSAVEYRADTKLYIERLTEPDADMIADANIVSGQYFMVGNKLYKATANIASGRQVIEGTNAIRKSLSEALNEINQ